MKKKIYSRLTYVVIGTVSLLSVIALIFVNRADLPLGGLIALNVFLIFVLLIVVLMVVKFKRVYLLDGYMIIMPLFSNTETRIAFNRVVEMENVFPFYIDPINYRFIYLNGEQRRKIYFIKAVEFIDKTDLGVALGIVKNR